MDRVQVYPGQIPLETDLLNTNKNTMVALAKLSAAIFGTATVVNGLACVPNSPAALNVVVGAGEIYSLQNIDGTAYSSLAADTAHSIVKQGIMLDAVTLACAAPGTTGQSINYLIQATYQDVDSGAIALPYYNASNPSQAYSGPNNTGTAQATVRKGTVVVSAKAGIAATTGSQTTPAPDAGYVGLYVVTVANGQTTITSANIAQYASAPIIGTSLLSAAQTGLSGYAIDTGSANVYQATYSPAVTTVTDGMVFKFKAKTANTGASTFSANGLAAAPIWGADHAALGGGEIVANGDVWVQWNSSLNGTGAWVLVDATGGELPVAKATKSNHAIARSQVLNVTPLYQLVSVPITAGVVTNNSLTLTAPCAGFVLAIAVLNSSNLNSGAGATYSTQLLMGGSNMSGDVTLLTQGHVACVAVTAGQSLVTNFQVTNGSAAVNAASSRLMVAFIPSP